MLVDNFIFCCIQLARLTNLSRNTHPLHRLPLQRPLQRSLQRSIMDPEMIMVGISRPTLFFGTETVDHCLFVHHCIRTLCFLPIKFKEKIQLISFKFLIIAAVVVSPKNLDKSVMRDHIISNHPPSQQATPGPRGHNHTPTISLLTTRMRTVTLVWGADQVRLGKPRQTCNSTLM